MAPSILFVRLSAIGDVINTLPAVCAVRDALPDSTIGYVVEDRCRDVVIDHPSIDRVHVYPRKNWKAWVRRPWRWPQLLFDVLRHFSEIRHRHYDIVLDFQGNLKGAAHAWFSGVPIRIGYAKGHCKEGNWLFSNRKAEPYSLQMNRVDKFLALLAPLGIFPSKPRYEIPVSRESRARVDAFLRESGLQRGAYVLMHPGTSDFGKLKRWPPERYAELARRLGRPVVVSWGPGEKELAESIAMQSGGAARIGLQTASLLDLAELIAGASMFIGADSGPLHLSSAVGVPSIALFGPKDPAIYAPYNPRGKVVRKSDRMEDITVDDVLGAM